MALNPFFIQSLMEGGNAMGGNTYPDTTGSVYDPPAEQDDPQTALMKMIQKALNYPIRNDAAKAFQDALGQFPVREEPGKMRKVLAVIGGLGGSKPLAMWGGVPVGFSGPSTKEIIQNQDLIKYRPYYQKLEDWSAKVKPLEQAAQNERYINTEEGRRANNEAMRLLGLGNLGVKQGELTRKIDKDADTSGLAWAKDSREEQRLQGYLSSIKDNSSVVYPQPDGNILIINKDDDTNPVFDTGIKSNKAGAVTQINARLQARLKEIAATGEQNRANTKLRAQYANLQELKDAKTGETWLVDPITKGVFKPTPEMYEPATAGVPTGTGIPGDRPSTDFLAPEVVPPVNMQKSVGAPTPVPMPTEGMTPDQIIEQQTGGPTPQKVEGPTLVSKSWKDPNAQTTTQKNLADFAKDQLPTIKDMRGQAHQLAALDMFGPIQNTLNKYRKLTGVIGNVQQETNNLNQLASDMMNEAQLAKASGKPVGTLLGEFYTNVSLLASAAAYVHFRGRAGKQVLDYMSSVTNPGLDIDVYDGVLNVVEKKMTQYASEGVKIPDKVEDKATSDLQKKIEAATKRKK